MKALRTLSILPLLLGAAAAPAAATDAREIAGCWATEPDEVEGNARVWVVQEDDGTFDGAIVWLEKPIYPPDDDRGMGGRTKVDRENPDPDLRKRPVLGLPLVTGFGFDGEKRWEGGHIYDPNNGKTYKSWAERLPDGRLKIRGYVGISLLGRTTYWTPLEQEACRAPPPSIPIP